MPADEGACMHAQALEKSVEAGGALDKYEIEGPDRAELLQDLGEFQLATVIPIWDMSDATASGLHLQPGLAGWLRMNKATMSSAISCFVLLAHLPLWLAACELCVMSIGIKVADLGILTNPHLLHADIIQRII